MLQRWRQIFDQLSARIPDYGVRRATQLMALMRYETSLLLNNKTESIEFATGLLALAFGAQLFRFESNFTAGYYGVLVSIAPREVWGVFMLFAGVDKILALLTATKWCRRVLSAVMTGVWSFIAAVCWLTAPNNVAPGIYTVIAFLCGWTYIRLRQAQ